MRFLCDQCKAKYQISDDKIAGKTVRMKCRKCGHMIEVRAEVTETSVANAAPAAVAAKAGGAGTPRPAGVKPAPPRKLATSLTSSGPARTPAPAAHPSALAGAFQRNVATNPATSSVRPPPGSADDSSALDMLSASANPWYVAINGVPVGPVRLSEIRKKAASGLVTETSLVWQEGLEEWRQVKTFPELASIVREAAASGRPSLVAPPPDGRGSMAPRPPAAAPAARNNVVPIASRRAAPEALSDDDLEIADGDATRVDFGPSHAASPGDYALANARPSLVAPDPFAAPAAPMARAYAPVVVAPHMQAPGPMANPYAPTVQAASQASMASIASPLSIAPPAPRRRDVNYFGIAMIGGAIAFGVAGAVVGVPLYFRSKAAAPAASASAVATNAAPSGSIATGDLPPVGTEPVDSAAPAESGGKVATAGGHASGGGHPISGGGTKAVDPSIADLLRGGSGGPTVGGGAGPSGGGGSSLSTSEIEGVVNNRKTGITRTCWERNNSNLSNANVTCHITIAANGTVSSSQADGSDPVVAKCIEQQVKGWTFPPSSGSTRVDLPFHFVRQ
ncbi:MAG: GYF domain-containing protein [Polyangiaceae bacterium]